MSDFIPEDVVVDILSRLPTTSLIRFRSVSKLWYALITSPTFINSHLNRSPISKNSYENLPLVILRRRTGNSPPEIVRLDHYKVVIDTEKVVDKTFREILEIEFPPKGRRFPYLVGYVKGLFCFANNQEEFFLWNLSIRRSISLPPPGIAEKTNGRFSEFGFDSRSNDYKVVRVSYRFEEVPLVQVYSLNAGSWEVSSRAGNSFPLGIRLLYTGCPPACLDGAIHFAAQHIGDQSARLICSFDLDDNVFKTISLPNNLANARTKIGTVVFRGLLSLLCEEKLDFAYNIHSIWIMKEYGVVGSWYKYVTVDITGRIERVIGIRNNGHILLLEAKYLLEPWELSSYDPQNKEIKKLGIKGAIYHFHVDIDEENLILLDKKDVPVSSSGASKKGTDSSLFSGRGWLRALGWIFESLVSVKTFMLGGNNDFRSVTAIVGLTISEILVPSLLLCHFWVERNGRVFQHESNRAVLVVPTIESDIGSCIYFWRNLKRPHVVSKMEQCKSSCNKTCNHNLCNLHAFVCRESIIGCCITKMLCLVAWCYSLHLLGI